jgi:hypothetical protein
VGGRSFFGVEIEVVEEGGDDASKVKVRLPTLHWWL